MSNDLQYTMFMQKEENCEGTTQNMSLEIFQLRMADTYEEYETMAFFFQWIAKRTRNKEEKRVYENSAKICIIMKKMLNRLYLASEELLGKKET